MRPVRVSKTIALILIMLAGFNLPGYAAGFKEAGSSLLLPTKGQAMNGELGSRKTKVMAGIEVAAVTAVTIIGFAGGGPAVWFAAGPLLANHLYSSGDAFVSARRRDEPIVAMDPGVVEAQRTLEYSRQRRYERGGLEASDIRTRIQRASEEVSY